MIAAMAQSRHVCKISLLQMALSVGLSDKRCLDILHGFLHKLSIDMHS